MPRPTHVLVTGSTRGIGRATVEQLEARGARVIGAGRAASDNVIGADLGDPAAAGQLWDRALERLDGRIDVLVNNAGTAEEVSIDAPFDEWQAVWARVLQVNLLAAADLSRSAVRHFREAGGGRIVNVSSRSAHRGHSPENWPYASSKGGMVSMTKTIARAYAAEDIFAFVVCPGYVMTDMAKDFFEGRLAQLEADIPLGRVAEAAEVANSIVYLALDAPPSMTGAVIDINGASYVR